MALQPNTFTTVNDVKLQLGITDSSQDSLLEALINAATDFAERYCRRKFLQKSFPDEFHNGENTNIIFVKNFPVAETPAPIIIVENEEKTPESADFRNGIFRLDECIPEGLGNVKVTYTGGYALVDIPADLNQAIILLVSSSKNMVKSQGIESETVGDYTVAYTLAERGMSLSAKKILDMYKCKF